MSDLEARVAELEVKLGFAEDLIDSLNQTVFRQQERLDLMERLSRGGGSGSEGGV